MAHKLVEAIPISNRILAAGAIAAAMASIIALYTTLGGPTPVMSTSPLVEAVAELEETHDADSIDQLSRWIRADKSERFDVQQRLEYEPANASLHEELLNVEEKIEENEEKRSKLRNKKK